MYYLYLYGGKRGRGSTFNISVSNILIGSAPAPSRPSPLKIKSNSITIAWSQSVCDGGHIPARFYIRYKRSTSYSYTFITVSNATQRTYTITGLSYLTSYDISIRTVTVDSRQSSYSIAATISTLPLGNHLQRNNIIL